MNRLLFGFIWWFTFSAILLSIGYTLSMVSMKVSGVSAIDIFGQKYLGITFLIATYFSIDGAIKGLLPGTAKV